MVAVIFDCLPICKFRQAPNFCLYNRPFGFCISTYIWTPVVIWMLYLMLYFHLSFSLPLSFLNSSIQKPKGMQGILLQWGRSGKPWFHRAGFCCENRERRNISVCGIPGGSWNLNRMISKCTQWVPQCWDAAPWVEVARSSLCRVAGLVQDLKASSLWSAITRGDSVAWEGRPEHSEEGSHVEVGSVGRYQSPSEWKRHLCEGDSGCREELLQQTEGLME